MNVSAQSETTGVSPDLPPLRIGLLVLFAGLSVAILAVGGWLTSLGFGEWYDALEKPWFQPPGWAFGPAWFSIFTLLAIATWQIARRGAVARTALWIYGAQLVLNLLWSLLFFTLHRPGWALVEIVVLDVVLFVMVFLYGRIHRAAGWMLVPYAGWLLFATAINVAVVVLN